MRWHELNVFRLKQNNDVSGGHASKNIGGAPVLLRFLYP